MNTPGAAREPQAVKSAGRVLDLLELLCTRGREMSHNDISIAIGIPKSSLTHLLRTLMARGYVTYSPESRGYRIGQALGRLVSRSSREETLLSVGAPLLEQLTARTRESSTLNQLRGDVTEVIATVSSPQRLVPHMQVGETGPLYALSGGKAILAAMPDVAVEAYLRRVTFEPITEATISSAAELRREIARVRHDGVAYSLEEFTPGISGIGVALLSAGGIPIGSMTLAIPTVRFSPEAKELGIRMLRAAAETIAGHRLPDPR